MCLDIMTAVGAYALPRTLGYLCSRPSEEESPSKLRDVAANIYDHFTDVVGKDNWDQVAEILVDNAWISCLAVSLFKHCFQPLAKEAFAAQVTGFVTVGALSWFVRYVAAIYFQKNNPNLARKIAPRTFYAHQPHTSLIPPELMNDPVLNRIALCPITMEPTSDPVRDPNGITVYDRRAILRWTWQHGISPVTRRPLSPFELVSDEGLKAVILFRIYFLQGKI